MRRWKRSEHIVGNSFLETEVLLDDPKDGMHQISVENIERLLHEAGYEEERATP